MTDVVRRYIGSGDVAAIVGYYRPALAHLAKWKNVSDVFLRLVHGIDLPRKRSFARGLREENPLRKTYRDTIGPVSELPGLIKHPRFDWAGGSPDGLATGAVVELKTHSVFQRHQWGVEPWSDKVPDKYALQCTWLCGLAGKPVSHVLCGFGQDMTDENGQPMFAWSETVPYAVPFDAELYATMEALCERFYEEHVRPKKAPDLKPVSNRRLFKKVCDGDGSEAERDSETGRGIGKGAGEDSASEQG